MSTDTKSRKSQALSWEAKFKSLQNKYKTIQKEKEEIEKKYREVTKQSSDNNSTNTNHDNAFWNTIVHKVVTDTDSIKLMIKNKTLDLKETDRTGKNVLILAAWYGNMELVQFCVNCGADLDAKDSQGFTALMRARNSGYYNCERFLMFAQMNANVGNEIKDTSNIIIKQDGISDNILNELELIGQQSKELFEKILMELMINIITKKLVFSDDLLDLAWRVAIGKDDKDPLKSELWQAMKTQCKQIIENGTKRDWYWLKKVLLPSTIWFKDIPKEEEESKLNVDEAKKNETKYLYFELLKLVDNESKNQLDQLDKDLNILADEQRDDWDKLVKWDIPNEYEKVRQDDIPNGIISQYTYNQLSESSGATFNSPKFYDYNQYLSQLVLLAQIVDEQFQHSVQDMFNIDNVKQDGTISFVGDSEGEEAKTNIVHGDGYIKYLRGPVKLIERARAKAQNDYADEAYPASACVLDLNRCCLCFNDISTLLRAVKLFVNKVNYYQSGNIIGIVRDKNGFIDYVRDGPQYADIKLNVLIRGKHNNIIGEVQFLLNVMKDFKDKAHNLYAIQRKQESMETSVNEILPLLLNQKTRLFGAGINGNIPELCKLMVISNLKLKDIMYVDPKTGLCFRFK